MLSPEQVWLAQQPVLIYQRPLSPSGWARQWMAGIMSLLQTAKQNDIDPFVWLRHVLRHLPSGKNNRLDEPLPFAENTFSE